MVIQKAVQPVIGKLIGSFCADGSGFTRILQSLAAMCSSQPGLPMMFGANHLHLPGNLKSRGGDKQQQQQQQGLEASDVLGTDSLHQRCEIQEHIQRDDQHAMLQVLLPLRNFQELLHGLY